MRSPNVPAPRIFVSAGEASGDWLGAELVRAVRSLDPTVRWFGMGGPRMAEAGVEVRHGLPAVSGLLEVARHLPRLFRLQAELTAEARQRAPELAVLIDFPDFHLGLARRLRRLGIPAVQYGGPSVWAWRSGRARAFAEVHEQVWLLFPFEAAAWEGAGPAAVQVVGHPAADRRSAPSPAADPPRVILAPGSRDHEVKQHLGVMLEAARQLRARRPEVRFDVAWATGRPRDPLEAALLAAGLGDGAQVMDGLDPDRLVGASAAVVAAGTATLEASLCGVPVVVVARTHPLTFALLKRWVRVTHLGLPSLLLGRPVSTELLQGAFTPPAVARELQTLLEAPDARQRAQGDARALARVLGPPGASARAARALLDTVTILSSTSDRRMR